MRLFLRSFNSNVKSILLSPIVWITLLAASLFMLGKSPTEYGQTDMLNLLLNCALLPLIEVVPLTIGIVAGIDILRERKNKFCDIQETSGKHALARYLAKICTYVILAFMLSLVISFGVFFLTWFGFGKSENFTDYTLAETIHLLLVRVIGYSIPVILQYVSLVVTVCLILKSSVLGICSAVFYCFFILVMPNQLHDTVFRNYFYWVPKIIDEFFACWHIKSDPINILPEYVTGTLTKPVIISYLLVFGVCFSLLTLDYYLFKNTKDV